MKNNVKKKEQEHSKYYDELILSQDKHDWEYLEMSKKEHLIKVFKQKKDWDE